MMKINPFITDYQKCSQYVKDVLGVQLFPYQEIMLKVFCDGLEVRAARGIGRSFVSECFAKYIANEIKNRPPSLREKRNGVKSNDEEYLTNMISNLYDKNNYMEEPDVILPYPCAIKCGVLHQWLIDEAKRDLSEKAFNLEYLCINKSDL